MKITLENIAPNPLIGAFSSQGEIWEKSLEFLSGECIHIQAPSGSGKSTLMGVLYGTRSDYSGSLSLDGNQIEAWSSLRTNDLSIVFQDLELLDDLTVIENIQLKNQLTNHFSETEIDGFLNELDVYSLKNKPVGLLSRGEKQRVAIIRAISMPFKWIFLDEPFSALDEANTIKAITLIKGQVEKNKAGLILANLFQDDYFNYTKSLKMA